MPNPKRRHSQQRSAKRRTHYKATESSLTVERRLEFQSEVVSLPPDKQYPEHTPLKISNSTVLNFR